MTASNYVKHCKYCKAEIVWLKKDNKNIAVNVNSLLFEDRRSLAMGLQVPFSALDHNKHIETCPYFRSKNGYSGVIPWRR